MSNDAPLVPEVWEDVRRARPRGKRAPLKKAILVEVCARARRAPDEHGYGRLSYIEVAKYAGISRGLASQTVSDVCPGYSNGGVCAAKVDDCTREDILG